MAHRLIKSAGVWAFSPNFNWVWWEEATAMLYYYGYDEFFIREGRWPRREDFLDVLLYGYFLTGWAEVDPWYFACKSIGIREGLWLEHRPGVRVGAVTVGHLRGGELHV